MDNERWFKVIDRKLDELADLVISLRPDTSDVDDKKYNPFGGFPPSAPIDEQEPEPDYLNQEEMPTESSGVGRVWVKVEVPGGFTWLTDPE